MKLRNPRLIRIVAWAVAGLIGVWTRTLRYRLDEETRARHPADPARERFIYAFWHESILAMVGFRVPAHVLISQHADGELIARACEHLGFGTVRGSTTRGGGAALVGMVDRAKRTHLAITPDGPRGPRRRLQPGVIVLASQTGLPIVPVGFGFARAWRARSWDRFAVPFPFSRVICVAGAPIVVPAGLDRNGHEEYRLRVEDEFRQATARAEQLAGERAVASDSKGWLRGPKARRGQSVSRIRRG